MMRIVIQIYGANFKHLDDIKWDHTKTFTVQLLMSGSVPRA